MKGYSLTAKLYNDVGHIVDEQTIEFIPSDCRYHGKIEKKAEPNKRIIFCTFNTLVDTCIEMVYEEDCERWEVQGTESDTKSGEMRYINFYGSWNEDSVKICTKVNGKRVECGNHYDEYFDSWLF